MLLDLASSYTHALNEGGFPKIESAWNNVLNASCQKLINDSVK